MNNTANITQIKENISNWEQIRNLDGLKFLTSGFGIEIPRTAFENWQRIITDNDNIHIYLGVNQAQKLEFYMVDSYTDALGAHNNDAAYVIDDNLFIANFQHQERTLLEDFSLTRVPKVEFVNNQLLPEDILSRVLSWQLYSDVWFDLQSRSSDPVPITGGDGVLVQYSGVVKCITVPFSDLTTLFNHPDNPDKAFGFFGIRKDESQGDILKKDILELILCNYKTTGIHNNMVTELFADVTYPVPPFSAEFGFNLFES